MRALRNSEAHYRQLFESSPVATVEYDLRSTVAWMEQLRTEGVTDLEAWMNAHPDEQALALSRVRAVGVNRAALRLFAAPTREELSKNILKVFTPEAWEARRRLFLSVWKGKCDYEGESTLNAIDGTPRRVHMQWWAPTTDGKPVFERTQLAMLDLTQTKTAELALAAERERFGVSLQSMTESVFIVGADGLVQFMNEAAIALTGCAAALGVGQRLEDVCALSHSQTGVPVLPPVSALLAGSGAVELPQQTRLVRRDGGERIVEGRSTPLRDFVGGSFGVVVVLRDITERVQLESELSRASKLESVGVLAGGLAHDFNNLLAVVIGNLTLAQMVGTTPPAVVRFLQAAERGALKARDITGQLLTFSRGGAPIRKPVLLQDVVSETVEFVLHGQIARPKFDFAPDLWAADVDRGQFGQIVQNLTINAMQSMPMGGEIQLSLVNDEVAEGALPGLSAGRYVRLSVADSGAGIPPEQVARIFEPYFTTKPNGFGLGLATVYSIVRKHDGLITVESKVGRGTTFHVWMQAASGSPVIVTPSGNLLLRLEGNVLFMDDEEALREVTSRQLNMLGLQVTVVADGAAAVTEYVTAKQEGRPYDAVILDLTVPGGMGGQEAMQKLLAVDPQVRGVVSSGYSNDPVMANHAAHGFMAVVPKPFQIGDLASALSSVLKRG